MCRARFIALMVGFSVAVRRFERAASRWPRQIDRTTDPPSDIAIECRAPRRESVRAQHDAAMRRQVFRQRRRNPAKRSIVALGPIKRYPEVRATRPARQARIIGFKQRFRLQERSHSLTIDSRHASSNNAITFAATHNALQFRHRGLYQNASASSCREREFWGQYT